MLTCTTKHKQLTAKGGQINKAYPRRPTTEARERSRAGTRYTAALQSRSKLSPPWFGFPGWAGKVGTGGMWPGAFSLMEENQRWASSALVKSLWKDLDSPRKSHRKRSLITQIRFIIFPLKIIRSIRSRSKLQPAYVAKKTTSQSFKCT